METHAAVPDFEDCERMGEEIQGLVEADIAEAAAEDDAECGPGEEIIDLFGRGGDGGLGGQAADQPPAEQQADDVGERVIMDEQEPDMEAAGEDGEDDGVQR